MATRHTDIAVHLNASFSPDYRHLDPQVPATWTMKSVMSARIKRRYGLSQDWSCWTYMTFSRPVSAKQVMDTAYDIFARGCSCEYDCCGHIFGGPDYATLTKMSRNRKKWAIRLRYARNI